MRQTLAIVVAALFVGLAVAGFGWGVWDVLAKGGVLTALHARPAWPLHPLGAGIGLAAVAFVLFGGKDGVVLRRVALVTAPLLVAWVRIFTYVRPEGRGLVYDQTLWILLLILALAVAVALASEDPWVRSVVGRAWRRFVGGNARPGAAVPRLWWMGLLIPALLITAVLALLSIVRFQHFNAGTLDLGMYDQIHWSMIHHRWFYTTLFEQAWGAQLSRFDYDYNAEHFMPIILLTTAIYWFYQSPVTLLLIQATFVGAAAFPLYFFTLRATGRPALAMILAMGWLLHPLVHQAVLNDYHPDALVGLFLFLALLGYESKRVWLYALGVIGVMACKEDMALLTLAMGVFLMATHPQRWKWGLATAIAGAVWFWGIATPIMQAAVAGVDDVTTIRHLDRFRLLIPEGADPPRSLGALAWMAMTNPGLVFSLLMETPRQAGLAKLLIPLGAICLVRPQAVILLAPAIGAHLFSAWSLQARFELYHAVAVLPWIIVTTVYAIEWLIRERPAGAWGWMEPLRERMTHRSVTLLLVMTVGLTYLLFAPLPFGGQWQPNRFIKSGMHDATVELVRRVPAEGRIAMTSALGPHLAQRPHIYHLPDLPTDTQYVVIDINVGTFPLSREKLQDVAWDWIEAEGEEGSEWELVWMHEEQHHFIFKRPDGFVPDPDASRYVREMWE